MFLKPLLIKTENVIFHIKKLNLKIITNSDLFLSHKREISQKRDLTKDRSHKGEISQKRGPFLKIIQEMLKSKLQK